MREPGRTVGLRSAPVKKRSDGRRQAPTATLGTPPQGVVPTHAGVGLRVPIGRLAPTRPAEAQAVLRCSLNSKIISDSTSASGVPRWGNTRVTLPSK